ncbi:MAG: alpha/beta fold hydrolase [Anaerolineales bacterium]|nr:alpha/beta fold hydrolase [Anaerolineales bacterium]
MNQKINFRYVFNIFSAIMFSIALAIVFLSIYLINVWTQAILQPARTIPTGNFLKENNIEYQDVTLITKDGIKLSAWYTPPKNGAVILLAHGYNDNRIESLYVMFAENDYGVLAWDFRTHGESEGEISTLGYYEQLDVEAALDFALAQEGVEYVGAWGGSMGASTVLLTASKRNEIKAVVADSAYPSLESVLRLNMPVEFAQPFVLFLWEYKTNAQVEDVNVENVIAQISPRAVFIIDGWYGGAILMNSPYRLYDSANEPKQLWVEDGVPHLGTYAHNPQRYENRVIKFFDEWLLGE